MAHPLVAEAIRKAAVAWVKVGDQPARTVWCLPVDGVLWVVSGPGEQTVPGLEAAREALVTLRGDHGGRIVTVRAAVARVEPDTESWAAVVPQLAGKRLNASGDPAALAQRWAAECRVHTLTPTGDPVEGGATLPDHTGAQPPRETPARRRTAAPFRLHRIRRR